MIPLKLTVKNFMCYQDNVPQLNLESIHIACLCGNNGHGKTALLDAITWALWGQARTRTQDELVHMGREDMAVDLEFHARNQRYRVNRRYSKSPMNRQGATILELYIMSDTGLHPITGNSVRETEKHIKAILHMDYNTFVNTAFLLQGRADLFTNSKPSERKSVLAEVLDLSKYQILETLAKEQSRIINGKIDEGTSSIELRKGEVARIPEIKKMLASTKDSLNHITSDSNKRSEELEQLRKNADSLISKQHQLELINRHLLTIQQEVAGLERQIQEHRSRVSEYEEVFENETAIRTGFAQFQNAEADLERLNIALGQKSRLDDEKSPLEKEIALKKQQLTTQITDLQHKITQELKPKANRLTEIKEHIKTASLERKNLEEFELDIQRDRGNLERLSAKVTYLENSKTRLLEEMDDTRKKFDLLDQSGAKCPLCQQPLGEEGYKHLRGEYEELGIGAKKKYQELESELQNITHQKKVLSSDIDQRYLDLNRRKRQTESTIASLGQQMTEAQDSQDKLQPYMTELEAMNSTLSTEDFASDEKRKLSDLKNQLSALNYDAKKHQQARDLLNQSMQFDELHRKLLDVKVELPRERKQLEAVAQMHERLQDEVGENKIRLSQWQKDLKSLPRIQKQISIIQMELDESTQKREKILVQERHLTSRLEELREIETQLQELENTHLNLVDEKQIYDELAVAFGHNGIQALIIEMILPHLQSDANALLGNLTENRMFLKLQLQEGRKERRLGLPSEELDIKISDEVGTRSYETFSGGEAFRINFSIRIALSKLLARRSGAPLPILFIDEGFGSQDSSGQERLKEAIQSIQEDFDKIIVITHVEEIKNSFSNRIEVSKTSTGSTFTVV